MDTDTLIEPRIKKKVKVNHFLALRKEVDKYFKENKISENGNAKFLASAIVIVVGYLTCYLTILFAPIPLVFKMPLCIVMGVFHALCNMNILHDAVHMSAFSNKKWNKRFGLFFNLFGASTNNWRVQHNVIHHKHTNVAGVDRDIDSGGLLRMSPLQERKSFHRFQHIYTWLLFGMLHLNWVTFKDFRQHKEFSEQGHIKKKDQKKEFRIILFSKIFYWAYAVVTPVLVMDIAIWQVLTGFVIYQVTIGLYLATVFQLAHVVEDTDYPEELMNDWMVHQLVTTSDFNPRNKIVAWFTGGLNNQVIHHLFPHISRVHYANISSIMIDFLEKNNLPYNYKPTFVGALASHYRQMRHLGSND